MYEQVIESKYLKEEIPDIDELSYKIDIYEGYHKEAMRHCSYKRESLANGHDEGPDNSRLAFLGQGAIYLYIVDTLFSEYGLDQHEISRSIASGIISKDVLAQTSRSLCLDDYILLGSESPLNGLETLPRDISSNLFRAFVGSVCAENGYTHAHGILSEIYSDYISESLDGINNIQSNHINPAIENVISSQKLSCDQFESLEILGDASLSYHVRQQLFSSYDIESFDLNMLYKQLVSNNNLSRVMRSMDDRRTIDDMKELEIKMPHHGKPAADALEVLIGAKHAEDIVLGTNEASDIVAGNIMPRTNDYMGYKGIGRHVAFSKSVKSKFGSPPSYLFNKKNHLYHVDVYSNGEKLSRGKAKGRRSAIDSAIRRWYRKLRK